MRVAFERSLELARHQGLGRGQRSLRVALHTSNILGPRAVLDTYNLISAGIRQLVLGDIPRLQLVKSKPSRRTDGRMG